MLDGKPATAGRAGFLLEPGAGAGLMLPDEASGKKHLV